MSSSIEKYTPTVPAPHSAGANLIREAAAVMADAHALAVAICKTQMVPKHFFGKPDECAAAMLYGASLGFDPMQSVKQIYVVHGQAALYGRAMVALLQGAGHEVWTVETSDESVTVSGKRKGTSHIETSTWDIPRAAKAGYTKNEKYQTDPQAMLYAKAASEVCRKIAPDVLAGVYAVEDLEIEYVQGEVTEVRRPGRGLGAALAASQSSGAAVDETAGTDGDAVRGPARSDVPAAPVSVLLDTSSPLAKEMYAAMTDAGISEEYAPEFFTEVAGRSIAGSKELTEDEAHKVIAQLEPPTGGEQG